MVECDECVPAYRVEDSDLGLSDTQLEEAMRQPEDLDRRHDRSFRGTPAGDRSDSEYVVIQLLFK
jgi:hypothetical protein